MQLQQQQQSLLFSSSHHLSLSFSEGPGKSCLLVSAVWRLDGLPFRLASYVSKATPCPTPARPLSFYSRQDQSWLAKCLTKPHYSCPRLSSPSTFTGSYTSGWSWWPPHMTPEMSTGASMARRWQTLSRGGGAGGRRGGGAAAGAGARAGAGGAAGGGGRAAAGRGGGGGAN